MSFEVVGENNRLKSAEMIADTRIRELLAAMNRIDETETLHYLEKKANLDSLLAEKADTDPVTTTTTPSQIPTSVAESSAKDDPIFDSSKVTDLDEIRRQVDKMATKNDSNPLEGVEEEFTLAA